MMHAARARMRARQIRPHRDMQFGRRTALAHLIDMDDVLGVVRIRIFTHLAS